MSKLYPSVVKQILAELRSGDKRVGDVMPSETALSKTFGVSRSTIRSALTELQRLGLIERKQGAQSRIVSAEPPPNYVHMMSTTGDHLMQFAGPARRTVQVIEPIVADEDLAERLQDRPGRRWILISQTRHVESKPDPVIWTDMYLAEKYADISEDIADYPGLVYRLIEERYPVVIDEIQQYMVATTVPAKLAKALKVAPDSPAIGLRRCYVDSDGESVLISLSVMPAEYFSYEINLRRQN